MKIAGILAFSIILLGCTTKTDNDGCFRYTYETGLKRGTLLKNQNYVSPYRQCVDQDKHILNKEKRPYG